jgi:anti-sigma regulatory factor (Ser/Thr protein kinase)
LICTAQSCSLVGQRELFFELENDPQAIPPIIDQLMEDLTHRGWDDELAQMRVSLALQEGLSNALYHGNLELSSSLMSDSTDPFYQLAEHRRLIAPYANRIIQLIARHDDNMVQYVIEDQGPGFDFSRLPDPTAEENIERFNGRGLFLIRNVMDEVTFHGLGNRIHMIMYKPPTIEDFEQNPDILPGKVA